MGEEHSCICILLPLSPIWLKSNAPRAPPHQSKFAARTAFTVHLSLMERYFRRPSQHSIDECSLNHISQSSANYRDTAYINITQNPGPHNKHCDHLTSRVRKHVRIEMGVSCRFEDSSTCTRLYTVESTVPYPISFSLFVPSILPLHSLNVSFSA